MKTADEIDTDRLFDFEIPGLDAEIRCTKPPERNVMHQPQLPPIAEGETYIGCIGDAAGNLYHVILLPGDNGAATWEAQMDWANSIGGDLPNRIEQAMLWANHRGQFENNWYWSNETHHADSRLALIQGFLGGNQDYVRKYNELRARAVRRLPI